MQCVLSSQLKNLNNAQHLLRNHPAKKTKSEQSSSNAKKPVQTLHVLTGHNTIHAPQTRDNVHGKDDGTQDSQLVQHIVGLLRSLRGADVDLGEVIAVSPAQETASC